MPSSLAARPRIVAHRGLHDEGAGGARENTIAALLAAIDAGVSWVEIDVRMTRDGHVVLLHDATLERLWGYSRRISEIDLAEVRELGGGARRIPLLSEALEAVAGRELTLLIDMDEPAPAVAAAAIVREQGARARTAWCGNIEAMALVRAELPDAQIWLPWAAPEPPTAQDIAALAPAVINVPHLLVGADFVDAVHELGCEVAVWTVNEPAQIAHLASIGVDSITTNEARMALAARTAQSADTLRTRERLIAHALAEHAAEITGFARREGIGEVLLKTSPSDHVTEIDRRVERAVRAVIGAQFPEHDVVGEEYGGSTDGQRGCWYVDPIDGTANLANGVPWTSFSLSLVEHGEPVVAALLDPVGEGDAGIPLPVPVVAAKGQGAWRESVRLQVKLNSGEDPLRGMMVTTELAGAQPWPGFHRLLDALAERHCTLRVPGSGTATLAGVALGRGVAAMVHRFSPIDHGSSVLVVAEAGGAVLDEDGEENLLPTGKAVFTGVDVAAARALWEIWREAVA